MKHVLLFILLLKPVLSVACTCYGTQWTTAMAKDKQYIALVRIKELLPFDEEKFADRELRLQAFHEVLIDEVALFKGTSLKKIKVDGRPMGSPNRSMCDLLVSPGQEWLIMADPASDGSVRIAMCLPNMLYRQKDGFVDWQYKQGIKWVEFAAKNSTGVKLSGRSVLNEPVSYYPNGNLERKVSYRKNEKHGTALYYYPDGTLYGRVEYKRDSLHGVAMWYNRKGQIESKSTYDMGIPVDTMITYKYPGPGTFLMIRSKQGIVQKYQDYQAASSSSIFLSKESVFKDGKQAFITMYRENGTIRYITTFHDSGSKWNILMKLVSRRKRGNYHIKALDIRSICSARRYSVHPPGYKASCRHESE